MLKEKIIEIIDGVGDDGQPRKLEFRLTQMPATMQADFTADAVAALAPVIGPMAMAAKGKGREVSVDDILAAFEKDGFAALQGVDKTELKRMAGFLLERCAKRVVRDGGGKVGDFAPCDLKGSMDGYVSDFRTIYKLVAAAVKFNYGFCLGGAAR